MVMTVRLCSSQPSQVRLYSTNICRFIAVEISVCLFRVSKVLIWSKLPWLNFIFYWGKQPRRSTKT